MSDEKPERIPEFPMDDNRSVGFHVAMGTLDAAASIIPGGGYGVQQLVKQFIGDPLERRREQWFTAIGEGLNELQNRLDNFDPNNIRHNHHFINTVVEATQIALKNHRVEKISALVNAVVNTAAGLTKDEYQSVKFLNIIDRFTWLHIEAIKQIEKPLYPSKQYSYHCINDYVDADKDIKSRVETIISLDHDGSFSIVDAILKDLDDEGLTIKQHKGKNFDMYIRRTSHFGRDFVKYISKPDNYDLSRIGK